MSFTSILSGGRLAQAGELPEPPFFADLNLDQVFAAVAAGRGEYRLAPFFRVPLRDAAAVRYRQEVMRDLENEAVRRAVTQFAGQLRVMREHLIQARKLRYRYQKERWFLDGAALYCAAVRGLAAALHETGLASHGFTAFRQYLSGYAGSAAFASLAADAADVSGAVDAVRYCVSIKAGRVGVTRYEGEADFGAQVTSTFAKFSRGGGKDYRSSFEDWPEVSSVEERILDRVARLYPDVFGALDRFCQRHAGFLDQTIYAFDREVQFYLAYLDFIAPLKAAGLEFCYPEVSDDDHQTSAEAAFDLMLAAKLMPSPAGLVVNDCRLSGPERIIVVTGPNHGGKTTFARMFGQLHYLASLGYPVPARRARLFLPDRIFTHFEREEDIAALRGKLAEELVRVRAVLDEATGSSLVVMNESFSSTTLRDAAFIGERVLERMTALGLLGVYVTFVDELSSLNDACVSMVGAVVPGNPAERTYKIVRKPADGLAYAAAIARKYGLTYSQLKDQLATSEPGGRAA